MTIEGRMAWTVQSAGKLCEIWSRIYVDLRSGVQPLVVLHGLAEKNPTVYFTMFVLLAHS
ncbi:hypothetical protein AN958_12724 [Leucoagaricus sp. SymC.cos]|nr:hypothetical protein AN958_12724 [Leucoagaricus sp. SymC.cos]